MGLSIKFDAKNQFCWVVRGAWEVIT